MRAYSIHGTGATGTDKTILTLIGGTSTQPLIESFTISSGVTPAEQTTVYHLQRFTAVGTEGSGYTPVPLSPYSIATSADGGSGVFSVEPTYTASTVLYDVAVHMRATYTWNAKPGFQFWVPPTAANGIGLKSSSSTSAYTANATIIFSD